VVDGPEVTPDGRELSDHATKERIDEDIDLFTIDEVIENNEPNHQPHGNDKYYDPDHNVTVVTEPGGDKIITVHIGP
jgi:hypothetical protein